MGCDYYIDKELHIYDHQNDLISYIRLEHERGYYCFASSLDEDEDGYEDEFDEFAQYVKETLEPRMKPIDIYSNREFRKPSFEEKYKTLVERELIFVNKTLDDVGKMVKIETRYER